MACELVQVNPGKPRANEQKSKNSFPWSRRCRQNNSSPQVKIGRYETNGSYSTALLLIASFRYFIVNAGKIRFKAWDLGGHEAARKTWRNYVSDVDGIIYLVDASNQKRF